MKIIIFFILIMLMLILRSIIHKPSAKPRKKKRFTKLITHPDQTGEQLYYVKINPNKINKVINLGGYMVIIKLVEVDISKYDISKYDIKIKVHIQYDNNFSIVVLKNTGNNKYSYTSHALLETIKRDNNNISYFLTIKHIYIDYLTEDWHDLVLVLNKYVEDNSEKEPLIKDIEQPTIINLLNPEEDVIYNRYNNHSYKTPYRSNVDLYGAVSKNSKDNTRRTIDEIRKRIEENNKNVKYNNRNSELINGESKTIVDID